MKFVFVPSKFSYIASFNAINLRLLPNIIGLVSTVQFSSSLPQLKKYLEARGKKVIISKSQNPCLEPGQVLGCDVTSADNIQDKVQAFLYIGSGKFHPLAIATSLKQSKPIFIFNPLTNEFSHLDKNDIDKIMARKRGQKLKFLSSETFGILVSTKPGQEKLKQAQELKNKLEKQKKKAYIFLFNDLDINQTENFPQVQCWINTACPGLSREQPFVWINDIKF